VSEPSLFPPPQPQLEPAAAGTAPAPVKSRRTLFIVLAVVAGVVLLCGILGAVTIGRAIFSISTEQATITPVIDRFMQAMSRRDTDAAYRIFSSRAQRQTPIADLEAMVEEPNYVLFEGYQSVAIQSTNLTSAINTDPDKPQGSVATVSGTVTYTDGTTGTFQATLEKESGEWRLFFINVTVPPGKIRASP
jgi:hypothetical protein